MQQYVSSPHWIDATIALSEILVEIYPKWEKRSLIFRSWMCLNCIQKTVDITKKKTFLNPGTNFDRVSNNASVVKIQCGISFV